MTRWFNQLIVPPTIAAHLQGDDLFSHDLFNKVMNLRGEVFREMPGRCTSKVQLGNDSYFVKQHFGVGWKEIVKNLITLKMPILGARTEMHAIKALGRIGINTTPFVAFGQRGINPATRQSFLITRDLGDIISLEDVCANWLNEPPTLTLKRQLIKTVAHMAGRLHANGLNHRDFYICHICLNKSDFQQGNLHLYLIDLHRMGIASKISKTHRYKDMAALHFSSLNCGLSQWDYLRFLSIYQRYCKTPLPKGFWAKVNHRAQQLYARQMRHSNRKW